MFFLLLYSPYTSLDLDQEYDDSQTPEIRTIPIEEEADTETPFHFMPSQTSSSKSPDACPPNSPSSSVSIVTSSKLPANGKSLPQSLSTFQNPMKPPSNPPFSVRSPSNVQSSPPYLPRCQNLEGSEQTKVSPQPSVSYNVVPQYWPTFKNVSAPDKPEISPDQPASQNHGPKYQTISENQIKYQVSGLPPANHNPVTQNIPGFEGDVTVAIATAVAALAKSQEQGSLIDTNLLVRLLRNPEEIPKLMNGREMATSAKTGATTVDSLFAAMSRPVDLLVPLPSTKPDKVTIKPSNEYQAPLAGSGPIFGSKPIAKSAPLTMTKPEAPMKSNFFIEQGTILYVETANVRESKSLVHPTSPSPLHRDMNYYKSLTKQHGENSKSVVDERNNPRGNTQVPGLLKNQKPSQLSLMPCRFFNKPRGCRNGSSCPFLHDISRQKRSGGVLEAWGSKRRK